MKWKITEYGYHIGYGRLVNGKPEYTTYHSVANYPHSDWVELEDGTWVENSYFTTKDESE